MQRSDAPLIKHLAKTHGPATAAEWQRPPLVLLPGGGFVEYLSGRPEREIEENVPTFEHLMWEDVVFDYPEARQMLVERVFGEASPLVADLTDRGRTWIRVRTLDRYLAGTKVSSPWLSGRADLLAPFRNQPERWLAIEAWEDRVHRPDGTRGFAPYPDVTLISRATPWDYPNHAHLFPNPLCRGDRVYGAGFCSFVQCHRPELQAPCRGSQIVMGIEVTLLSYTLVYLLRCDEYPVEVRPAGPPKPPTKFTTVKPWTREDLGHIILIDPGRVHDYRSAPAGGSHVPPRPHQRRGHWRQLQAERYKSKRRVWVRPAWVGDLAWQHEGQRYRVLTDLATTPVETVTPISRKPTHP